MKKKQSQQTKTEYWSKNMNISTFLRNWALHYIEPTFLYLPRQRVKKGYITIRPVSYVHENYYYDGGNRQYFYVDYQKAIVTGTLRYEQGSKEDNRAQYPCLYRIYEYNEKRKKYIPINTKGEKYFDCTIKSCDCLNIIAIHG